MSYVINFTELRQTREKFAIALAGTVYETLYRDVEDPTPIQFDLAELADEISASPPDEIDRDYRNTISWFATAPGESIVILEDAECLAHHPAALVWARDLLERTQAGFGFRLLGRRGA